MNDERFLYKAGAPRSNGLEPHAEYYSAQLAEAFGLPIRCTISRGGKASCAVQAPLFASYDTGFVTFSVAFGVRSFEEMVATYAEYGSEASELFAGMTVFGVLVANDDRHLGNFGFLFDDQTRIIVLAARMSCQITKRGPCCPRICETASPCFAPHPVFPLEERFTVLLNDYVRLRIESLLALP